MAPDVNINFGADSVGGDKTTVGNITDSSGIGIGRQASAQVGHLEHGYSTIIEWLTNLERRLLSLEVHAKGCKEAVDKLLSERGETSFERQSERREIREEYRDKKGNGTTAMAIAMVVVFTMAMALLVWLTFGGVLVNVP